jgi:hypothetical protein
MSFKRQHSVAFFFCSKYRLLLLFPNFLFFGKKLSFNFDGFAGEMEQGLKILIDTLKIST